MEPVNQNGFFYQHRSKNQSQSEIRYGFPSQIIIILNFFILSCYLWLIQPGVKKKPASIILFARTFLYFCY
ncbi:hypothetical protein HanRHA438_Chr09g0430101 [Helianthus annuus]|nr:hypothetical protein HanIR_Chr09g0450451 [Helianthus annuus]KAJ0891012.1 hypothetical protein HanRHA438_Chr09g0430101 [Helianthus annuus]